jgi:hypothetical protein
MNSPQDNDPTPNADEQARAAAKARDAEEPVAPYQPTLISGKWVILVIGAISIAGSAFGWLWTYDAQRGPRDFWGIETWKLIGTSRAIRAQRLVPEPASADGKPKPAAYDGLIVVRYEPSEAGRYVVETSKRVENEPGLSQANNSSSLREALANHRSYNWNSKAATLQRPSWRYALVFAKFNEEQLVEETAKLEREKKNFPGIPTANPEATLLFDADCRFVRVPAVDKPIMLQPGVAEQFKKFFETQLPEPAK